MVARHQWCGYCLGILCGLNCPTLYQQQSSTKRPQNPSKIEKSQYFMEWKVFRQKFGPVWPLSVRWRNSLLLLLLCSLLFPLIGDNGTKNLQERQRASEIGRQTFRFRTEQNGNKYRLANLLVYCNHLLCSGRDNKQPQPMITKTPKLHPPLPSVRKDDE